jgi:hypothetical protein
MKTSRVLLVAPMATFGVSGLLLYWYFMLPGQAGPLHDNLIPELIGFCIDGFFLVGLLSLIQGSREQARRKEMWLSLRGSLRGILSNLDIAFLAPNAEPTQSVVLEQEPEVVVNFMRELQENRLSLRAMTSLKKEGIETLSLARDMIPVAAQLGASHMRWWIQIVNSMRQLSKAQTREDVEQNVYLLLENINEFDRLAY